MNSDHGADHLVTTTLEHHLEHVQKLVFFLSTFGNGSFQREQDGFSLAAKLTEIANFGPPNLAVCTNKEISNQIVLRLALGYVCGTCKPWN